MTDTLTIRAYTRGERRTADLTLIEAALSATLDSPALSLTATFHSDHHLGELEEVEIRRGNNFLFRGMIDEQETAINHKGRRVLLEARSRAALLLDNEALPHSYADVGLTTIFDRHIAPYGFSLAGKVPAARLPLYTVAKGMSEWEALEEFTLRAMGVRPTIQGDLVHLGYPVGGGILAIGEGGHPYTSLSLTYSPYQILSQILIRDDRGGYTSGVESAEAISRGIRRKRYQIPSGEFAASALPDADRRLRQSHADALSATATLPGIVEVELGWNAILREPGFEGYALYVSGFTYRLGAAGAFTEVQLAARSS
jgi:hypothetical protein